MPLLCEYKDIFGKPGEGLHETRFLGMAAMDLIGFIVLVFGIVMFFGTDPTQTLLITTIITILLHYLFCVPTALNKTLGLA
jgi:uncharacterized membrane-anchored protein